MEFETIERCGRIYVVKNGGVESAAFVEKRGGAWYLYDFVIAATLSSANDGIAKIADAMDNWYTIAQAAARLVELGVYDSPPSAHTLANLARAGAFPGAFKRRGRRAGGGRGGSWRIPEAALEAFAERRRR